MRFLLTRLNCQAKIIRSLGKRAARDIIEIGRRLIDAKRIAQEEGRGKWGRWLDGEFGWTDRTARRFMTVGGHVESDKLSDLSVPVSGLYLLAAPATPAEVIPGSQVAIEFPKRT